MRVADYIFKYLADHGTKHVFLVTGGGAMYLNDGLRCEKRIMPVCCHHEQACAIAAEGYVRAGNGPGVVSVTTGPGGTNTLTGVIGQWLDSVPVLYLSGQVKFETTTCSCPELRGLRQLGDQEINIVDIVRPVTKYAAMVDDPKRIRYELEKALHLAHSGRPGPVWLDIPLNVQGALIEEGTLTGFQIPQRESLPAPTPGELAELRELLSRSERPVIVAGRGIDCAGAGDRFRKLALELGIPVLTTFNGLSLVPDDYPLYAGRIGTVGQRAGNFVLQNADLVLTIGTRNNIRQVSYDWKNYARAARKVAVDVDRAELGKKTFVPDLAICADAGAFLAAWSEQLRSGWELPDWSSWRQWCRQRQEACPVITDEHRNWRDRVNPYFFMRELTSQLSVDWDVVAGNGTACVALFQSGVVKCGQRMFWNSGCASMGYDLPAALGAGVGSGRNTVCLAGDGSIMMNLQELQTIRHHQLPLKIFLLENNGYSSIKQTQGSFFDRNELIGCDGPSGVSFPDFAALASAFGFKVFEIASQEGLADRLRGVLAAPGPVFCVVRMPDHFTFSPKLSSRRLPDGRLVSSPLEDMFPFLEREEFLRNMIVPAGTAEKR